LTTPDGGPDSGEPEDVSPDGAHADDSATATAPPTAPVRLGASTFTIEGRSAPALFVVGWLASLLGLGLTAIGLLSGGGVAALGLILVGLLLLSVGLIAAAGSQGIERRALGVTGYAGPSPVLVFAASIPVSFVAVITIGVPLGLAGVALEGPFGALLSVAVQALVYVALIRLLVVDTGALDWRAMGVRALDRFAIGEMIGGAFWAVPVFVATVPVVLILRAIFPVTPESVLPPTGETVGFAISLMAGAVVGPFGEEMLFRAFATTAWVRRVGAWQGVVRAALVFAFAHVMTISGTSLGEAFGLAAVGFGTRIPIALALGWLFVRRGTVWSSFGLHAAFNGLQLVIAELALRST
jgi:membrane protease YdiL (CAAX protease family)